MLHSDDKLFEQITAEHTVILNPERNFEMSQVPVQPSGSELSNVESDVVQTINLADTVITLIREPITLLYNSVAKTMALKRSLGRWQEEALDDNGQARIPVLPLKNFEEYLGPIDGAIVAASSSPRISWIERLFKARQQTEGLSAAFPSAGSASWAYFLFALGIHPGMKVAEWRPRPETNEFITLQNGGVQMEFEGPVLCHIINLFSTTPDPNTWNRRHREKLKNQRLERRCSFTFGQLAWTTGDDELHAHFIPGVESTLALAKQPFGLNGILMDTGTTMASYYTAFYHGGVSDPAYLLASPEQTLPERIARLTTCFNLLAERNRRKVNIEPLLISYDWFEEAARVKRRVLAQGGNDHSFFEDILKTLDNETLPENSPRNEVEVNVRQRFLLDDETFTFSVPGSSLSSMNLAARTAMSVAEKTLLRYEQQPAGSWKHSLFYMRTDVLKVLNIPKDILITTESAIQLIEFTSSCELWNRRVFLGA